MEKKKYNTLLTIGAILLGFAAIGEMFLGLPENIEIGCLIIGCVLILIGYRKLKKKDNVSLTTIEQQKRGLIILLCVLTVGLIIAIIGTFGKVSSFPPYGQLIFWVGITLFYILFVVMVVANYKKRINPPQGKGAV